MEYFALQQKLAKSLNERRYKHSIGVSITAEQLASRFGTSPEKAKLAGLLHDCAREFPVDQLVKIAESMNINFSTIERYAPILLHAHIGAMLVETKYQIDDLDIKQAIRLHTTGGMNMSKLDKIIYLADMIEPSRDYPEVGVLRQLAESDLDKAMLEAFNQSIQFVMKKNNMIHPDTVMARNEIIFKGLY